jgi:signal transduction histidine kinase
MQIRDRIKELRRVPAGSLRPNPRNWRTHPARQRDALRGILAEVGYAGALLARELPDGSLELVDGHLRAETTPDAVVPVLVLDVDEGEAAKLLATFDPLSALAETNHQALEALLVDVETDNQALGQLLADISHELPSPAGPRAATDKSTPSELFQIVIECRGEEEQRDLFQEFTGRGLHCRLLNL